jgi:hypothetical protein
MITNPYQQVEIVNALRGYFPEVYISFVNPKSGLRTAELGGKLPYTLVEFLRLMGAEVLEYTHHGVTATVVNF